MDIPEAIVVKAVTNGDYFGEPGVIRAIMTGFVPLIVGQPDREVMFIHRKDLDAETSITIEIHAEGSLADQELAQRTVERLMGLDKLSYNVTFTEIIDESRSIFGATVASLEAEGSLTMYIGGINITLAREALGRQLTARYHQSVFQQVPELPMPWDVAPGSADAQELRFIVDMLMDAGVDELGL